MPRRSAASSTSCNFFGPTFCQKIKHLSVWTTRVRSAITRNRWYLTSDTLHAKAAGSAHGAPLQFVHWARVARHYKMLSIEGNTAAAGEGIEASNIGMVAPYVLKRKNS